MQRNAGGSPLRSLISATANDENRMSNEMSKFKAASQSFDIRHSSFVILWSFAPRRLPAGHGRSAELQAAGRLRFLCRRPIGAPAGAGHGARGYLKADTAFWTGRRPVPSARPGPRHRAHAGGHEGRAAAQRAAGAGGTVPPIDEEKLYAPFVNEFPIPITEKVVQHGYHRFMIYCVVCHDPLGTGHGKIVERGYTQPPSYHIDRLRRAAGGPLLRGDQRGLRFHAVLRRSNPRPRPLGDRGLHQGAASQPALAGDCRRGFSDS